MPNETNIIDIDDVAAERDMSVTRLPFENAAEIGWSGDVSLWRLAEPIHTPYDEEVSHVVVSQYAGDPDFPAETAVFGATEEGSMWFVMGLYPAPPVAVREGLVEASALLSDLGFVDVTAE